MQELFVDKIHFFKFLSMNDNPQLHQLKFITSTRSTEQASLCFHLYRKTPSRKGKYPMLRARSSTLKFFLFYNLTCISQIFVRYLLKWSKLRHLKAEVLWVPQKVRTVLVRYLLSEISILIYSCNECGTSKIYSCLEDHHFPRQVIIFPGKFKTRN